ncbi:hypothetical protein [Halalkalibacter alkalisediminis]|uniref:Uncharacterized protein n=1 Tax=Halalkalibacter alkalisediminis TaxID=935616 RepID=A0ABV6NB69_9BACI|nr:hypothetical protein [Halalkalibacter alkalisediminis]
MSEEPKHQTQSDFFSDLMFGRRPMPPEQEDANQATFEANANSENPSSSKEPQSNENKQPDQLESIFALVQSLGPVIDKLAPLAGAVSSYFNKNKKEETTKTDSKKKNAND